MSFLVTLQKISTSCVVSLVAGMCAQHVGEIADMLHGMNSVIQLSY